MSISSVSGTTSSYPSMAASTSTATASNSSATTNALQNSGMMNKDSFMKLFLASLQYQDPNSPMDSNTMMQQMSQLSMIEQISNLGTTVNDLKTAMTPNPLEKGAEFLGKQVTGVTSSGQAVNGVVNQIQNNQGVLELMVNNQALGLSNISSVANSTYATYNS